MPSPSERPSDHKDSFAGADLRAKLADTIELLHLWKSEAFTYRLLAEAVVTGTYSIEQAKRALREGAFGPEELRLVFIPLTTDEYRAFDALASFAGLAPEALAWACVDAIMTSADDEDVLRGCAEIALKRFRGRATASPASER